MLRFLSLLPPPLFKGGHNAPSALAMGRDCWVDCMLSVLFQRRRVKIKAKRSRGKMKSSPIFPRDENGCCDGLGYDPRDDFSELLGEARKHSNEAMFEPTLPSNFSDKRKIEADGRKSKKSWKRSPFSWWKLEKSTPAQNILAMGTMHTRGTRISKPQRDAVSAPIAGRSKLYLQRKGHPASRPLSGCFTSTRVEEEAETPYMWLDQINYPSNKQAFGPIYLVT
uniref:Rhizopuspepsin-4 n=2 Tax=Anthurium amnicola TaxID=1678845 RepID=A0A1D1XDZ3_9ARAE